MTLGDRVLFCTCIRGDSCWLRCKLWHQVHCAQAASSACHEVTWYAAEHIWASGLTLSAGNAADTQPAGRFTGSGMTLRRATGSTQNRLKLNAYSMQSHRATHRTDSISMHCSISNTLSQTSCSLALHNPQQQLPCAKIYSGKHYHI